MRQDPERDFLAELANITRRATKRTDQDEIIVPRAMQIPDNDLFSIIKRSNLGYNKKVFLSMPREEAIFWSKVLNKREVKKREQMIQALEEVFYYEPIMLNSFGEDPYWNPKKVTV